MKPSLWSLQVFLLLAFGHDASAQEAARSDRTNLLVYHNTKGEVKPVKSVRDWQKRRSEILLGMQEIMGPLPGKEKRCALDPKIESEVDCGSYVRRLITYSSEPNSRVPAYLLIPKTALNSKKKVPAILCLHPTDMKDGHKTVVESIKPNRDYARQLAERGYVTLAPAYPIMANYQPDLKALGYKSGTMKAIWDNIRGLDYLESLPFVKKGSFGAIGHSLGGHNSIYTSVFEPRIKVIVSSCGFDSYVDYMNGTIKGWTSERYMPALATYQTNLHQVPFDFYEMVGALAPRPFFINAPLEDSNFKFKSVDAIVESARPIYALYEAPQNLMVEHPDCAHDFPDSMRQKAYDLFDQTLRK